MTVNNDADDRAACGPIQHGGEIKQGARAFASYAESAPARSPTRPPTSILSLGGRVGERAGAVLGDECSSVGDTLRAGAIIALAVMLEGTNELAPAYCHGGQARDVLAHANDAPGDWFTIAIDDIEDAAKIGRCAQIHYQN